MTKPSVTLRLQHFMTPAAHAHRNLLSPWAEKLKRESDGRITLEIYTGMALGGAPSELYDQSSTGAVDLAWMLPSYNPGRFLKSEVFELPFVASPSAEVTSRAFHEFVDTHAAEEFSTVRRIFFWTHDYGVLCLNRGFNSLSELVGRRVRYLTRAQAEILQTLGIVPIRMPIYDAVAAFGRGELDGMILPWEGVRAFGVLEHATHFLEFNFSPTLYTQTHMLTMNQTRYDSLDSDLKEIIDQNSGPSAAAAAGAAWDLEAPKVREVACSRGGHLASLSSNDIQVLRSRTQQAKGYWIREMERRKLDGNFYLDRALTLVAKNSADTRGGVA